MATVAPWRDTSGCSRTAAHRSSRPGSWHRSWRSPRQVALERVLVACDVEPLTEQQARAVGRLAAATGHHDVVDLAVVEGALRRGDRVVTSDPHDLVRAGLPPERALDV